MNTSRWFMFLFCGLLACIGLQAQTSKDKIEEPQFPGGRKELLKYMEENMVHPDEMRRLIEMGVDCIMTDDPALMKEILEEYK